MKKERRKDHAGKLNTNRFVWCLGTRVAGYNTIWQTIQKWLVSDMISLDTEKDYIAKQVVIVRLYGWR